MYGKGWDGIKKGLIVGLVGVILFKSERKKDINLWRGKDTKFWKELETHIEQARIEEVMDMEGWSESEKEGVRRMFEKSV
ncbi:MAG: hypothetical protein QMC80_07515 [Thermoplasmatales archaeon]|nr:hypothetical protein [Thermoplasmatales archaeon]